MEWNNNTYVLVLFTIASGIVLNLLITRFFKKSNPVTLVEGETVHLKLIEKEEISHDTRRFRLGLPTKDHFLGLPVGQHISLRYTDAEGKLVMRSYTPVSSDDVLGYVDLVVKVYFKDAHPKFPDGGKMSQYLESMAIEDTIEVSGPKGKLSYAGNGVCHIKHRIKDTTLDTRRATKIGMIAGGTGITPMLQVIRYALQHDTKNVQFSIIFANQTENDILLRKELDEMVANHDNVKVWYTLDRPGSDWKYSTGFVTKEMIEEHMPAPADDVQIFLCGPPPMIKFAVMPALETLGFTPNMHFSF